MRKRYLDNIRWATVLLVLIYHVCYIFNGVGILGGIPGAKNIPALDVFSCIVYPWFMVLLFCIAGMSARYAFAKRSPGEFVKERARRLLVPSTLGLFVLHWITGYLNIRMGGGLEYMPSFLVYPISALSGIGPLWFIQLLFLFSCILALLRKADAKDRVWKLCGRANEAVLLLLSILIWGASHVLNAPLLTVYRFGIYFAAFLIGYYVFSHEEVQDRIERMRLPMLAVSVLGAVGYGLCYGGSNFTEPQCLESLFTNLYLWAAVLAVLGCGKRYFGRKTAFTEYMTGASFGWYIVHYPVLISAGFLLHTYFDFPAVVNYGIALAAELVLTFAVYEGVRRMPVIRFLVLGQK